MGTIRNKLIHLIDLYKSQAMLLGEYKQLLGNFKTIVMFGYGRDGRMVADFLSDVLEHKETFFLDNDETKHGKNYRGIRCYGKEKLQECDPLTTIILITSTRWTECIYREIYDGWKDFLCEKIFSILLLEYLAYGNAKKQLLTVFDFLSDETSREIFYQRLLRIYLNGPRFFFGEKKTLPTYFPDIIKSKLSQKEVFIDCGAYLGDTIEEFVEQTKNRFESIYGFELDEKTFEKLKNTPLVHDPRIHFFPIGVSDHSGKICYKSAGVSSTYVFNDSDAAGLLTADVAFIDGLISNGTIQENPSFVKMDIKGAEMDALKGMKNLISREKPKLAICIYYKLEDLYKIPCYIHTLVPTYKFFIRHHTANQSDTVLYCTVE